MAGGQQKLNFAAFCRGKNFRNPGTPGNPPEVFLYSFPGELLELLYSIVLLADMYDWNAYNLKQNITSRFQELCEYTKD